MAGLRRLIAVATIIIGTVPGSLAQSVSRPEFEAAAIKPNNRCSPGRGGGGMTSPGRMTLECAQLRDLILTAYGIYGGSSNPGSFRMQVLGGPSWIDDDRYDFMVKAGGNPPLAQMYGPMLQALLEDRFKLKVHPETRERPVYLLTIARGGPKLKAAKEGSCIATDIDHPLPKPAPGQPTPRACGSSKKSGDGKIDMYGVTMADLSTQLGLRLDRDVIDKTAVAGMFDVHLEVSETDWAPRFVAGGEVTQTNPPSADFATGSSIFSALQHNLG
jgi:uncharacterized protein (TIGR03435 family)